jgi:hypothetical protein
MKVTLTKVWLHEADNLGEYITAYSERPDDTRGIDGEVRAYTNGRLRAIVRDVRRQTIAVRLVDVNATTLAWLDEHIAEVVMFRDTHSRLLFASYFALEVEEYKDDSGNNVLLTLNQVTHSIAV